MHLLHKKRVTDQLQEVLVEMVQEVPRPVDLEARADLRVRVHQVFLVLLVGLEVLEIHTEKELFIFLDLDEKAG